MRRFATLDCLVDSNDITTFSYNNVQSLRQALLSHVTYQPRIQQALQHTNFHFHRTCSYGNILRECHVGEGRTLLMFWRPAHSESGVTVSMSASSCSSIIPNPHADRELRSSAQQTDITCRYIAGMGTPVSDTGEARERIRVVADSLTAPGALSPPGAARSRSILGSVCALLLAKQASQSAPKEVSSVAGSLASENICRICFGGASAERLERPCGCRGTIAAVHRSCLERWLLQAATSYCELCRHHYVVTRSHKWSWMRSLIEWARSGRGRALAADAWRGIALGAASVLGTARALHAADRALQAGARAGGPAALAANLFSSLLIGIIGALNGLLTTWILLKIQEHQMSWQTWRDSTLHVRVLLADDVPEDTPTDEDERLLARTDDPPTIDRSTNVADPFMVSMPFALPDS
ncbi:E3 ubiquitin-protein ligase MARCHF1-like isoform X1 [Cydia strobilella]|uniref:E3 ubiquitin-protein ligase MARCHF1-like isoform X1 n=2 Tax=Cydia strobilella TaxID=1100964 RepID=UPI0030064FBB